MANMFVMWVTFSGYSSARFRAQHPSCFIISPQSQLNGIGLDLCTAEGREGERDEKGMAGRKHIGNLSTKALKIKRQHLISNMPGPRTLSDVF